jgi:hypothetical protein
MTITVFLLDDHEIVRRGVKDRWKPRMISGSSGRRAPRRRPWPASRRSSPTSRFRGTDLVGAVRTVASGQSMLDPRAASQLMARRTQAAAYAARTFGQPSG